jgi:hypothetical protein
MQVSACIYINAASGLFTATSGTCASASKEKEKKINAKKNADSKKP